MKKLTFFVAVLLTGLLPSFAIEAQGDVWISSYVRADGTVVEGHWRSAADGNKFNNWSTRGNTNPHTKKAGSGIPEGTIWISGYTRADGAFVKGHFRTRADGNPFNNWTTIGNANPSTGEAGSYTPSRVVWVKGYTRKDGVVVQGYFRTLPNENTSDNWSAEGNINPATGKPGWVKTMKDHETIVLAALANYNNTNGAGLAFNEDSINILIRSGNLPECVSGVYQTVLGETACVSKDALSPKGARRIHLFEELYSDVE